MRNKYFSVLSLLLFAVFSYAEPVPIGFTLYSSVENAGRWIAENHNDSCQNHLSEGLKSFDAVTFNIDYKGWHQGDINDPMNQVRGAGYLELTPATAEFVSDLMNCFEHAIALNYRVVVLKLKIMDLIRPESKNVWRSKIEFDPFNGNYASAPFGPVGLAKQAIRFFNGLQNSTRLVVSVNDEYGQSLIKFPHSWAKIFRNLKDLSDSISSTAVGINLSSGFPHLLASTVKTKKEIAAALVELDVIGWSLYRPFYGVNPHSVLEQQKREAARIKQFMKKMNLTRQKMAVFEFGVTRRENPYNWNGANIRLSDQARAYQSWLKLLQTGNTPVEVVFSFWFQHFDPRRSSKQALLDYKSGQKVRYNLLAWTPW